MNNYQNVLKRSHEKVIDVNTEEPRETIKMKRSSNTLLKSPELQLLDTASSSSLDDKVDINDLVNFTESENVVLLSLCEFIKKAKLPENVRQQSDIRITQEEIAEQYDKLQQRLKEEEQNDWVSIICKIIWNLYPINLEQDDTCNIYALMQALAYAASKPEFEKFVSLFTWVRTSSFKCRLFGEPEINPNLKSCLPILSILRTIDSVATATFTRVSISKVSTKMDKQDAIRLQFGKNVFVLCNKECSRNGYLYRDIEQNEANVLIEKIKDVFEDINLVENSINVSKRKTGYVFNPMVSGFHSESGNNLIYIIIDSVYLVPSAKFSQKVNIRCYPKLLGTNQECCGIDLTDVNKMF